MSIQMRGAEVAKAMKEKLIREREELNAAGVNPCLTIIRVGAILPTNVEQKREWK